MSVVASRGRRESRTPWYIGCYGMRPEEHFVGVNGMSPLEATRDWNYEVEKIKQGDFEAPARI